MINGLQTILDSESLTEANQWYYAFRLVQKLENMLEPTGFRHAEFQITTC